MLDVFVLLTGPLKRTKPFHKIISILIQYQDIVQRDMHGQRHSSNEMGTKQVGLMVQVQIV